MSGNTTTTPEDQTPSRGRRAVVKATARPMSTVGGSGSVGVVVYGLVSGDRTAAASAVAGVLPVIGMAASAYWTFSTENGGLWGIMKEFFVGDRRPESSGDAAAATDLA
jgi:hypothetical protein